MGSCNFYYVKLHAADDAFDLAWAPIVHLARGIAIHYLSGGVHKFHLPEFVHIVSAAARGEKKRDRKSDLASSEQTNESFASTAI
jgi:hypothetical protein